jgi:hypothetical protein
MNTINNEVMFLGFCVEVYKNEKKMNGQDAFNYLYQTGATRFISQCYDSLHTTGHLYIVNTIDEFIRSNEV